MLICIFWNVLLCIYYGFVEGTQEARPIQNLEKRLLTRAKNQ